MKKSTKIITTAVALALAVAAMVVGIYAATAGSATITANVSYYDYNTDDTKEGYIQMMLSSFKDIVLE